MKPFLILILIIYWLWGQYLRLRNRFRLRDGEECVITHDHEGDDHDHGGCVRLWILLISLVLLECFQPCLREN